MLLTGVSHGLLPKLRCILPSFLLIVLMLILFVICCVSPSTFYVITAIFTMVNMTWVRTLVVFRGVGAWRLHSALSINWHSLLEEEPVTNFLVLPNFQEDEAVFREPP